MLLRTMCLVAVTAMQPAPVQGGSTEGNATSAEVLVLGVYHGEPGRDVFNMQADDHLAPKRQKEIAELTAVLKRFKPTKIAVEHDSQGKLDERYAKYLFGSGHLGWLQQSFNADPTLRLRKLEDFTSSAASDAGRR